MRTLEQLGISKTPWSVEYKRGFVLDQFAEVVAVCGHGAEYKKANARLIAAATTMYKTLFDEYNFLNAIYEEMPNEQIERRMLAIADALAAASGESDEGETK